MPLDDSRAVELYALEQSGGATAEGLLRSARPSGCGAGYAGSRGVEPTLRHEGCAAACGRRWLLFRGTGALREEHGNWLCPTGREAGGDGREPASVSGGDARYQCLGEGGAICALLRLLQHSADYV